MPLKKKNITELGLLALLPFAYLVYCLFFLKSIVAFYIFGPDPAYLYMINGAILAGGKLAVGLVEHPGTPIQCFAAVIIFIKHLFSANNAGVYLDVLQNPESYLQAICSTLAVIFVLVTFFTGRYVYKRTGNLGLALFFQLLPLERIVIEDTVQLHPEVFIATGSIIFIAYLYVSI